MEVDPIRITTVRYGVYLFTTGAIVGTVYCPEIFDKLMIPDINDTIRILYDGFTRDKIAPDILNRIRFYGVPLGILGVSVGCIAGGLAWIVLSLAKRVRKIERNEH